MNLICSNCNEEKSEDNFGQDYRYSSKRNHRTSWCNFCYRIKKSNQRAQAKGCEPIEFISENNFRKMILEKSGKCDICGQIQSVSNRRGSLELHIDHDHNTGKIRGLLCQPCNTAIGKFNDDVSLLERAIRYLTT